MVEYKINVPLSVEQYRTLLNRTTLGERRPLNESERVESMLKHANLIISAWHNGELIGVARSLTDFSYCCYLADLAVRDDYQKQGIGQALIQQTQHALHPKVKLILLAAPQAVDYYPHIGFEQHPSAWTKN
ncbi:GNAT family N-acetyltransferase [Actinobacillus indolicus]|uniref:GNAT family N-acetyltransferase n=1 Tax=Actinobacillus indolicus TaxID=51049 RepID=A0A4V1AY42_9PAST|nr:GNAT family N-acetyltransferase [Actinobacillus indolicus]QBQ64060.1 GNAT family N-acetyltransferase [Actinobacillus indolicus]